LKIYTIFLVIHVTHVDIIFLYKNNVLFDKSIEA